MSAGRVQVKIAEAGVLANHGVLYTIGLGSCVALALYDAGARVAGLAHIMLPQPNHLPQASAFRFAPTAVPQLVADMLEQGARADRMFARIVGGAAMFADLLPPTGRHLGERNVNAVKAALESAQIPLRAEAVGGSHGRSVFFDASDGSVIVRAVLNDDVFL